MKREISSSANGRVNLLGEHLDYNGGAVLPLQIDKCVRIYLSDNTNEVSFGIRKAGNRGGKTIKISGINGIALTKDWSAH